MIISTSYFFIGTIQKAHRLEGELTLDLQIPNLKRPSKVFIYRQAVYVPYLIEVWHSQGNRAWVQLAHVEDRNEALKLRGHKVFIDKKELPYDIKSHQDMVGKLVKDERYGVLGYVHHIYQRAIQPCLAVYDHKDRELLIPLHHVFIKRIEEKSILVSLPPDYLNTSDQD